MSAAALSLAVPIAFTTMGASDAITQSATSAFASSIQSSLTNTTSVVARARGATVSLYASPSAAKPFAIRSNPASTGASLVYLVASTSHWPNWLEVYLPSRPNQSTAWVHASAVTLSSNAYRVTVHLAAHKMIVTYKGKSIVSTPIGEGRSVLPTPLGTYFIVDLLKQPNPTGEYGPYAFGLSAFSNVLQSFGGGPGQIGIHGTDAPNSIGKSVSHGCIRVPNALMVKLAKLLPLGTPVMISK